MLAAAAAVEHCRGRVGQTTGMGRIDSSAGLEIDRQHRQTWSVDVATCDRHQQQTAGQETVVTAAPAVAAAVCVQPPPVRGSWLLAQLYGDLLVRDAVS